MEEQDKTIRDTDVEINQEELDQQEQQLTEEFPVTEPEKVLGTENTNGEVDDTEQEEEKTPPEGTDVGEKVSERDEQEKQKTEENVEEGKEETPPDTEEQNNSSVQDDTNEIVDDVLDQQGTPPTRTPEDLLAEIEDLKFEKETQEQINNFSEIVEKQRADYANFQQALEKKVMEEFNKFGIPLDADVDELKEVDPSKYQILNNIITNAQRIDAQVSAELKKPIIEASENIVFRVAGTQMKKYNLTQEQYKEAAATFVQIMNKTGIEDLGPDLKNKVELAVARAKMIVDTGKEVISKAKDNVKEAIEETKQVIKDAGKKIEDYTKAATPGSTSKAAPVGEDNVMELYLSKNGNDRIAFFQKHKDLIMKKLKDNGMPYSDNRRTW